MSTHTELTADEIIARLDLRPMPNEGGYYRETYRGELVIGAEALPADFGGGRNASTAIYYLITPDQCSAMHRVRSDEVFHFYAGDPVEMLQIFSDGRGELVRLGNDLSAGLVPQVVVRARVWQGARLAAGGKWALLGTTVAPGFEFVDYKHGQRAELLAQFPDHAEMITALTPK